MGYVLSTGRIVLTEARDYFISQTPLIPSSALHKALKRRKTPTNEDLFPSTYEPLHPDPIDRKPSESSVGVAGADGEVVRRVRVGVPELEEIEARPAVVDTDTADMERDARDLRKGRKVEIEKSNVLMMCVIYPVQDLIADGSGPTGTGKTLMTKTLARVLDVPFA